MLHKSKLKTPHLPKSACVDRDVTETFHPLSYYLNGGIDLTGQALDKSAEVEFDNEEQLKELETTGAMSVPYGDPRESKFSIVEKYGRFEAEKLKSKTQEPTNIDNE